MGFSGQEYWSGLPFPSPGDLPSSGIQPRSPALQADALTPEPPGPSYGGGNEDSGDLLQKVPCMHCYTRCPQPFSRPPLTHTSPGDSWTLRASLGQSLVGSLFLSPGSWCTQGPVCTHQELVSQACVSSGGSMEGLMATSSKRYGLVPYPGLLHPEPLSLWQSTADRFLPSKR